LYDVRAARYPVIERLRIEPASFAILPDWTAFVPGTVRVKLDEETKAYLSHCTPEDFSFLFVLHILNNRTYSKKIPSQSVFEAKRKKRV